MDPLSVHRRLQQEVAESKKALAEERLKLRKLQKEKDEEKQQALKAHSQSLQEESEEDAHDEAWEGMNPGEKVLALMHHQGSPVPEDSS